MNNKLKQVIKGYKHKYYQYTVELSHFYDQIVTGTGYGELIVNYKPRETDKQKEQRVRITQNRTKSIAGKIEGFLSGFLERISWLLIYHTPTRAKVQK